MLTAKVYEALKSDVEYTREHLLKYRKCEDLLNNRQEVLLIR